MLTILDYPHHVYPNVAAAQAVVQQINSGQEPDDVVDITFVVVVDPSGTGKAIVEVLDITDGAHIAYF